MFSRGGEGPILFTDHAGTVLTPDFTPPTLGHDITWENVQFLTQFDNGLFFGLAVPPAVLDRSMAIDEMLLEHGCVGGASHDAVDRRHVQRLVDKLPAPGPIINVVK
jgi:hypothetical protein